MTVAPPEPAPARAPAGFRRLRRGRRVLVVADTWADAVTSLPLLEEGGLEACLDAAPRRAGRGRVAVVPLPGRSERVHLRVVRHGGWLGGWLGDRLLGPGRPLAELHAASALAAAGAPVVEPVLVWARRRGPLWQAAVGTRFVEDAPDALELLRARPERARRLRAAAAAGRAVRRFHDAGGRHADLHVGNLLVRERDGSAEVLLVDLDRAHHGVPPDPRRRMAELMRLYRSLWKHNLLGTVGPRGVTGFFAAYTAGDRRLRGALRSALPRERRRLARHAWLYRSA